jgi:chromosome segregation protein
MRLTRIKLAGFKSFVDPTSVNFPSNLTGVVGPNGCGKSNIIDAVRWVMGEISAKHLRGDSMADVIFNGSSARKPVGTASIELVFDNSDGAIGGEYAGYAEVSLKRIVSRDGTSTYLINGARCRRKDITQLFLGTGLGSRSYAIIEQGMISRLIEAKPDELRAFLEEAAGISKYKERRRETENRMAHTRENLERLNDLREEVEKQIRHLQRQAATARRYQALKEEERKLNAELLALRMRDLDSDAAAREQAVREREIVMQAAIADQRALESSIESARAHQAERSEALNEVQGRYYQLGAEAARSEQAIQHARELRQRQKSDLEQVARGITELSAQLQHDQTLADDLIHALSTLGPQYEGASAREKESVQALAAAEEAMQDWQRRWESYNASAGEAQRAAQVERARIEEIENRLRDLVARRERIGGEQQDLQGLDESTSLRALAQREAELRAKGASLLEQLQAATEDLQRMREQEKGAVTSLDQARANLQSAQGRLVSLEALQQAALGLVKGRVTEWLASHNLEKRPRLAQQLKVTKGWERAVETVLGSYLEAVSVDGLDAVAGLLDGLEVGQVTFVSGEGASEQSRAAEKLLGKVSGPAALTSLLDGIYAVDSLHEALARRGKLNSGESIITRDGIWIGRHWLRVSRDRDTHAGVLVREQEIRDLRAEAESAQAELDRLEALLARAREDAATQERARDQLQVDVNRQHQEHASTHAQLEALRAKAGETLARLERLTAESDTLHADALAAEEAIRSARARLEQALGKMHELEAQRSALEQERDSLREALAAARTRMQQDQASAREVAIQLESRRSAQSSTLAGLERMKAQVEQLAARRAELESQLQSGVAPLDELEAALERALAQRLSIESELREARVALEAAEAELRSLDERRLASEDAVEQARAHMEQARLGAQEIRVRRESLAEQFAQTHFELATVVAGLPAEATQAAWEQSLAEATEKIGRLGSVNLAAIDEFKEQSERKEYLDRQFTDLTEALNTLETAIRKIDRETRQRFQDTFDKVNSGLKEKFPRLFGGGHAYLEMTGEDILSAGVAVMARPPGKRNSTIHLLSGGEKALTAVALVFSIFELNPAPFCLLDEVDAPLDDHNVGRFCDIVRDMSQRVQFIFITHNKSTMELASQLIGVTMSEPGVSRLVAVDVDEAVRMAAM